MPLPTSNPLPIQFTAFRKEELATDAGVARLNLLLSQYTTNQNALIGAGGPTLLPSGVDVQGARVTGLAPPTDPTDAISAGHANSNYSASAVSPQLDLGGANALKGLAALYITLGPMAVNQGLNAKITLAKLTTGGSEGSITIVNSRVTAYTPAS